MLQFDSDQIIDGIPDLIKIIFPDNVLPFHVNEALLNSLSTVYNPSTYKWELAKARTETTFCSFLNKVCTAIHNSTKVPIKRVWSAKYRDTPLPDSPIKQEPDIVLIDAVNNPIVTWRTIRAVAEITSHGNEVDKLVRTVVDKSSIMLTTQADRVFVPILSVWGHHRFRLTITDLEGQLRSMVYELSDIRPTSVSLDFLRMIVGLCFTDTQHVGYDPTMVTDEYGIVKSIKCCGKIFNVVRTIYETQSSVVHATRVWEVEHEKKHFVLKDAWVASSVKETEHLKHIAGVRGVPEFVCGEDVSIDGKELCTGNIRGMQLPTMRVRQRIVTASIGSHISGFRTKRELISALRDIVITLKELSGEKDTVHRDISYSNILLLEPDVDDVDMVDEEVDNEGPLEVLRPGLLIDFEYAARLSEAYAMSPGKRTGTLPFMAIELLVSKESIFHKPRHDLESIFFVFVYICTNLSGPGAPSPVQELRELKSLPIASWFNSASSLQRLGLDKLGDVMLFEERIIPYFSPYFQDLKPCANKLCKLFFPTMSSLLRPEAVLHDAVIKVFDDTLKQLPADCS